MANPLLIKAAVSVAVNFKDKLLKFVVVVLLLPIILIGIIIIIPSGLAFISVTPLLGDNSLDYYIKAVNSVKDSKDIDIDYNNLAAIDAVRFEQDFSKVTQNSANRLANMFVDEKDVKSQSPVYDANNNIVGYTEVTNKVYSVKPVSDVMKELNFSNEQRESFETYLDTLKSLSAYNNVSNFHPIETLFKWPLVNCSYSISSPYGARRDPFTGALDFHYGVDIAAPAGSIVVAAADGEVLTARYDSEAGNFIRIRQQDGTITRYLHLTRYIVKSGQQVHAGDIIGYVGSTGDSTGPHLHFEVIKNSFPVDPLQFYVQ